MSKLFNEETSSTCTCIIRPGLELGIWPPKSYATLINLVYGFKHLTDTSHCYEYYYDDDYYQNDRI